MDSKGQEFQVGKPFGEFESDPVEFPGDGPADRFGLFFGAGGGGLDHLPGKEADELLEGFGLLLVRLLAEFSIEDHDRIPGAIEGDVAAGDETAIDHRQGIGARAKVSGGDETEYPDFGVKQPFGMPGGDLDDAFFQIGQHQFLGWDEDPSCLAEDRHFFRVAADGVEQCEWIGVDIPLLVIAVGHREGERDRQQREQIERVAGSHGQIQLVAQRWPQGVKQQGSVSRLEHGLLFR